MNSEIDRPTTLPLRLPILATKILLPPEQPAHPPLATDLRPRQSHFTNFLLASLLFTQHNVDYIYTYEYVFI